MTDSKQQATLLVVYYCISMKFVQRGGISLAYVPIRDSDRFGKPFRSSECQWSVESGDQGTKSRIRPSALCSFLSVAIFNLQRPAFQAICLAIQPSTLTLLRGCSIEIECQINQALSVDTEY